MKLEIRNINKFFNQKQILFDVSFEVNSGQAMGFLGRNGAGKTTTFRCLMDVFKQDSGSFYLDGKPFDPKLNRIGYLPEERGLYHKSTVLDQLIYFGVLRGGSKEQSKQSALEWIEFFGLLDYKNKKLETLSKGNQQKIQIAQAFINEPDILILDEPFSGLDPVNSQIFKDAIKLMVSKNKLVIFSSHQMAYVEEMCDEITLIDHGKVLLSGELEKVKEQFGNHQIEIKLTRDCPQLVDLLKSKFSVKQLDDKMLVSGDLKAVIETVSPHLEAILSVGQYRPSLQEIFVETVGGDDNA